jgi:hypothetical protein
MEYGNNGVLADTGRTGILPVSLNECTGMDKKSLFWRYGHMLVKTDLKHCFHGGDHGKSRREGQDRVQTPILKR